MDDELCKGPRLGGEELTLGQGRRCPLPLPTALDIND